jgi:hypothetical protein
MVTRCRCVFFVARRSFQSAASAHRTYRPRKLRKQKGQRLWQLVIGYFASLALSFVARRNLRPRSANSDPRPTLFRAHSSDLDSDSHLGIQRWKGSKTPDPGLRTCRFEWFTFPCNFVHFCCRPRIDEMVVVGGMVSVTRQWKV